jgi:4-phytase/acid phosphatase
MSQVGFGRLSHANLTQILSLHSLYFDLAQETSYPARVQGSNILGHIVATLRHAAGQSDALVNGGFGEDSSRFVFIAAHDTNIANVAGILHAHWFVPGDQEDPSLPGGGLVFELWRHTADSSQWVRVRYISETLDQMHADSSLTPANPPAIVPIFLPGCSLSSGSYECPLPVFEKMVTAELMPSFMTQ